MITQEDWDTAIRVWNELDDIWDLWRTTNGGSGEAEVVSIAEEGAHLRAWFSRYQDYEYYDMPASFIVGDHDERIRLAKEAKERKRREAAERWRAEDEKRRMAKREADKRELRRIAKALTPEELAEVLGG